MKRRLTVLLVALFVASNLAFLAYQRWFRSPKPLPEVISATKDQDRLERETKANAIIAEWSTLPATPLLSDNLPASIETIPAKGCLSVISGGIPLDPDAAAADVTADLNVAIAGLLRAYASGGPGPVLAYMRERDLRLDQGRRRLIQTELEKRGDSDLDSKTDDEIYSDYWEMRKGDSHWSGLIVDASCRQLWDAKGLAIRTLFNLSETRTPTSPLHELAGVFLNCGAHPPNFAPPEAAFHFGSPGEDRLLIADVKLLIQYDATMSSSRTPYFVRFVYNADVAKWQPLAIVHITASVGKKIVPTLLF